MYNTVDEEYRSLVETITDRGNLRASRAGDTLGIFGYMLSVDLAQGFPLLTTKKVDLNNIYHELNWFLRGETNVNTLKAPQLWLPWASEDGECGPVYGAQWTNWQINDHTDEGINQVEAVLWKLKNSPSDRRMIVSAWNVKELALMTLPPCHLLWQVYVSNGSLDMNIYQRSCDTAIGLPYNIASYAILLTMLANEAKLKPGRLNIMLGDVHIYREHLDKLNKQINREPRKAPSITMNQDLSFWDFPYRDDPSDFELTGYDPHPTIRFPLNV